MRLLVRPLTIFLIISTFFIFLTGFGCKPADADPVDQLEPPEDNIGDNNNREINRYNDYLDDADNKNIEDNSLQESEGNHVQEKKDNLLSELNRNVLSFFKNNTEIIEAAAGITEGSETEYEALERIYDWVTHNISYDVEKYHAGEPNNPNPLKTMQEKKGTCGDYTKLTEQLLQASGIETKIKSGEVVTDRGKELHAWNEAKVDGVVYALDTTWGAGFLTEEGQTFFSYPSRLYLTSPENLKKLHSDIDYRQQQYENLMRKKALAAPAYYIESYEEEIFDLVNQSRQNFLYEPLRRSSRLQDEARVLALKLAEKECRGEEWTLDLQQIGDNLNQFPPYVSSLGANFYIHWGNTTLSSEEIYRLWMEESKKQRTSLPLELNHLGIGAVRRGELIVLCKLFSD